MDDKSQPIKRKQFQRSCVLVRHHLGEQGKFSVGVLGRGTISEPRQVAIHRRAVNIAMRAAQALDLAADTLCRGMLGARHDWLTLLNSNHTP